VEMNQWYLEELQVMPDHVHMLIQLSPSLAISKVGTAPQGLQLKSDPD